MSTVSPYPVAHGLGQKRRKAGHRLGGDGQFHSWQQNPRERVWWVWGKNPGRHQAVREAAVLENQRREQKDTPDEGLWHHRGHIKAPRGRTGS